MRIRVLGLVCVLVLLCSSPLVAADHTAWLAKLVGVYASLQNRTPIGDIPFAMDMVREADGSVHGRTYADKSIVMQGALGDFAGQYELAQVGTRFNIVDEGGKLYGQQVGQERRELKPSGPAGAFAVEGVPYTLQFGRDDKGAVTHLQLIANGQEMMRASKVK